MMTASFTHSHDPYVARQQFWDLYTDDAIPMPAVRDLPDAQVDPQSRRLRNVIGADTAQLSDDQIRDARHAYLANISYVDDHVGEMIEVLDHHNMRKNTVVVFTADHDDMLGERGLWYKMNYCEHSARIPLIVNWPGVQPSVNASLAGLLDLAPTLLELADVKIPDEMDGASVPLFDRPGIQHRTVVGEYLGEGAIAPIFMIRRGQSKYIWSQPDPAQLYDLDADPSELRNLALSPEHATTAVAFEAEVSERWDLGTINAAVRSNQQLRATVDRALRQGRFEAWDFGPQSDATNQYMRNHLDLNEVEAGRRA